MSSVLTSLGAVRASPATTELPSLSTTVEPPSTGRTSWSKCTCTASGDVGTTLPTPGVVEMTLAWADADAGTASMTATTAATARRRAFNRSHPHQAQHAGRVVSGAARSRRPGCLWRAAEGGAADESGHDDHQHRDEQ